EQNIFDHNGWNASIPGAEQTIFSRNAYLQLNNGPVTFIDNISTNSASEGVQARSGGTITGNLFVANSTGLAIGFNTSGSPGYPVEPPITSTVVTGNVILNSRDINSASGLQPRGGGIAMSTASGSGVQISNNIIANPMSSAISNENAIGLDNTVNGINFTN